MQSKSSQFLTFCKRHNLAVSQLKETENGFKISNKMAPSKLASGLNQMRKDAILCDVHLQVADQCLAAHRSVLAVVSDYFQAMFTIGMEESHMQRVDIHNIQPHVMSAVLDYCYTGIISVTVENVQDLLVAADMLQIKELKQLCVEYMMGQVDVTNSLGLWQFSQQYNCPSLQDKCCSLVVQRFPSVAETDDFLHVPEDILIQLLDKEDLCLGPSGEDVVFESVIRWCSRNASARECRLHDLLRHVRLKFVSQACIERLPTGHIFRQSSDILAATQEQITQCTQPERSANFNIYVCAGYLQSRTGPTCPRLQTVEEYSSRTREWRAVAAFPVLPSQIVALTIRGRLLCVSVDINSNKSIGLFQGLWEYSPVHNRWSHLKEAVSPEATNDIISCMLHDGHLCYCARSSCVYVICGAAVSKIEVEEHDGDLSLGGVTYLPSLPLAFHEGHQRRDFTTAMCQGNLYVFGGTRVKSKLEFTSCCDVYMYDFEQNNWVEKSPMLSHRAACAAVELGGYIYALGGFHLRRLKTVERYDPETNTWTYVANMAKERTHACAVVAGDSIYIMGGKSYAFGCGGARKVLKTCEKYNLMTDSWEEVGKMLSSRCMMAAAVL